MDITRSILNSMNRATIRIYNLGRQHRNAILKDFFVPSYNRTVILQAGYGQASQLPTIYYGTLYEAFSKREGTDYITELTCLAGAWAVPRSFYNGAPIKAGTVTSEVIRTLMSSLVAQSNGSIGMGYIGSFPNPIKTAMSPTKTIFEELKTLTGGGVFIDNNRINCMNNGEVLPNPPTITIDSSMGLLETPTRELHSMTFPVLFLPQVQPGQNIYLDSTSLETVNSPWPVISKSFNGLQKVQSVHHVGMISDSTSGILKTEINVNWGITAVAS
jgi:hypothetical protein